MSRTVCRAFPLAGLLLTGLMLGSCASTQSRFVPLGQVYPVRTEDCSIEVFRAGAPTKEFVRISRIDVHLEKTHFIRSGFEDALSELKKQACLSGADAVIEIEDRSTNLVETRIYHLTATGIKYK
jgi:hypothetical protein